MAQHKPVAGADRARAPGGVRGGLLPPSGYPSSAGGARLTATPENPGRVKLDDVELATLEWVWWFNHHRLLEPLGFLPPAEYEMQYALAQVTRVVA